jgi:hypothetical protein
MTRLLGFVAYLFGSLGIALLIMGLALVPEQWAFADAGTCAYSCSIQCGGDQICYTTCVQNCCSAYCNGDPVCTAQCDQTALIGDDPCLIYNGECSVYMVPTDCNSAGECGGDPKCACKWIPRCQCRTK